MITKNQRIEYMLRSLQGLMLGDAFGENFFIYPTQALLMIDERAMPQAPWKITDDSVMALGVCECLLKHEEIVEDELASIFARNYAEDIRRGYGGTAHQILREIGEGKPWQQASSKPFSGMGSMGNGSAMRVAPLGAYFFDDTEKLIKEAIKSAIVTHWHPEGQAGAVAIALAAAWYTRKRLGWQQEPLFAFLECQMIESDLKVNINKAQTLPRDMHLHSIINILGNGSQVLVEDTVPFVLWCVNKGFENLEEAMWFTVSALGDRDTTCAMVGGILACFLPTDTLPETWHQSLETLQGKFGDNNIRQTPSIV